MKRPAQGSNIGSNLGVADDASKTTWPSSPESFGTNRRSMNILPGDLSENCWLRDCFEIRSGEAYGGGFENRSAADIWVREHRKRRKRHQMAARVEFPNRL
ncbi:hypothetical protein GCM10010869_57450 [Mesorhizobium tianshanense]|nr:hypothetical protein GCM10010869_57450 [Mesorhizobium tianshanense]